MRISTAIKRIKKHCKNHKPLYFYNVDRKSNFYYRILKYVATHYIPFDFKMFTSDYDPFVYGELEEDF